MHTAQGHDQGLLFKDQDKDKDCIVKDKDQDKDCILVLKESLRTRTNITGSACKRSIYSVLIDSRHNTFVISHAVLIIRYIWSYTVN